MQTLMTIPNAAGRRRRAGMTALMLALLAVPAVVRADHGYLQTNLVSDLPGIAQLQDPNLVNPWGISFSTTSPFWVSDNGTGLSTLYAVTNDAAGSPIVSKLGLEVAIPGEGVPTGQVFNGTAAFNHDPFIFAGEDGVVSGWRGALGGTAEILAMNTNAVYKGITLSTNGGSPTLILANFAEGTVDVYDSTLKLAQYADPKAPAGYAPFNVQTLGKWVFVSFAKKNPGTHDDLAGAGHGLIDLFDPVSGKFTRFATGSDAGGHIKAFNSPWGMALAPKHFGDKSDSLLVGNFGSGTIMAFEANGEFGGLLKDSHHQPMVINGLWGLTFGNGGRAGASSELFFSAGLNDESDGLFGRIIPTSKSSDRD